MTTRALLLLVPLLAACGSSPSSPSSTTTTSNAPTTESFEVTLDPGESTFYSFSESVAGAATVTLASVVQPGRATALSTPMTIGMGTPAGEGCTVTDSLQATPALTPQLNVTIAAGVHCISIGDSGQLPGTVIAAVRFTHQ